MREAIIDYNEVVKTAATKKALSRTSRLLDLGLKSFLFELVMKYATEEDMQSVLSKDRKFVSSIQSLEQEFKESHDRLFTLQQNT